MGKPFTNLRKKFMPFRDERVSWRVCAYMLRLAEKEAQSAVDYSAHNDLLSPEKQARLVKLVDELGDIARDMEAEGEREG